MGLLFLGGFLGWMILLLPILALPLTTTMLLTTIRRCVVQPCNKKSEDDIYRLLLCSSNSSSYGHLVAAIYIGSEFGLNSSLSSVWSILHLVEPGKTQNSTTSGLSTSTFVSVQIAQVSLNSLSQF